MIHTAPKDRGNLWRSPWSVYWVICLQYWTVVHLQQFLTRTTYVYHYLLSVVINKKNRETPETSFIHQEIHDANLKTSENGTELKNVESRNRGGIVTSFFFVSYHGRSICHIRQGWSVTNCSMKNIYYIRVMLFHYNLSCPGKNGRQCMIFFQKMILPKLCRTWELQKVEVSRQVRHFDVKWKAPTIAKELDDQSLKSLAPCLWRACTSRNFNVSTYGDSLDPFGVPHAIFLIPSLVVQVLMATTALVFCNATNDHAYRKTNHLHHTKPIILQDNVRSYIEEKWQICCVNWSQKQWSILRAIRITKPLWLRLYIHISFLNAKLTEAC